MTDVHDKKTRSYNASRIRGKDTTAELIVRKFLFKNGFRYKLYDKRIIGKPDIVLPKYKVIVDVRGCFWHGHKNCKYGDKVKTSSKHYQKRIKDAIARDERNIKAWEEAGWKVLIVWDRCELEDKRKYSERRNDTLNRLKENILYRLPNGNTSD